MIDTVLKEVQLYEFVTSAEFNAVSKRIGGVSEPGWNMVVFDGTISNR